MRAQLVAGLLITMAVAGCLADGEQDDAAPAVGPLPDEAYAGWVQEELHFVARDGTYVHGTAYLPTEPLEGHDQQAAFGTVLNFSPYYTNLYGIDTDGRLDAVAAGQIDLNQSSTGLFVAHGFAFVAASVPGTGQSGGCFDLGGRREQTVMAEFIDWVGAQPWSNGNVGMYGASYDGTTQWMAAIHAPEALRTIVPWVSITDFYEYEYLDGASFAWWGPFFLPYYLLEVGWNAGSYTLDPTPTVHGLLEDLCPGFWEHFTQAEKTYATGVFDAWWQERDYQPYMGQIDASVLMVHGMQDWNVKPLHTEVWDRIPGEKVFWLQQMQHNVPWRNGHEPEWIRRDYNATLLAWYDHYLHGVDNGVPDALPAVWVQDHDGAWRTEATWPPEGSTLALQLGDAILSSGEVPAGQTVFATPPSMQGNLGPAVSAPVGPDSPEQYAARFVTEPFIEDLRIAGSPTLDLDLTVDRAGYSHVVAQLYRVSADGTWEWIDFGARGLAQREGRTHDDDVPPLETLEVPVSMNPIDVVLRPGERLGLLLSGDDNDWVHPNGHYPTFILEHGSTLALPVASATVGMDSLQAAEANPYWRPGVKEWPN